jgi:CRISPR/Cas system CSM-associated protein Csm2 small subunit
MWRKQIVAKVTKCANAAHKEIRDMYSSLYLDFERRARISLAHEVKKLKEIKTTRGLSKTEISKTNKLDVIESSELYKSIFESIIEDKYSWYSVGGVDDEQLYGER